MGMKTAAGKLDDYPPMKFVQLNIFVLSTLLGERNSRMSGTAKLWKPIFNQAVQVKNRRKPDNGIERYTSTKVLLVDHMKVVANAKYAKAWTALDLHLGLIATALQLEYSATKVECLPNRAVRYLLSGHDCPPQPGHDDVQHGKIKNLDHFTLISSKLDTSIWAFPGCHLYVHYSANDQPTLEKTLKMEDVVMDNRAVFVRHGYV